MKNKLMKKDTIIRELKKIKNEDLSSLKLNGKTHLFSCNRKLWKHLKIKYPNILTSLYNLIEIAKLNCDIDKCLKMYFCECGNEKVTTSKFCSDHKCPAKNKSVAKNCFLTKLKKYGNGNYNNYNKMSETCLKKYGVKNVFSSSRPELNGKQTKLKRYGNESFTNREKAIKTYLAKYGENNYMSTKEFRNRSKQYFNEKYGRDYFVQTDTFQDKRKETCLEKYNKDSFSKTDEFKNKCKETWINKYGVDHPMKSKEIKNKVEITMKKRYGDHFSKTKYFRELYNNNDFINKMKQKEYITKKKNNSFNTSSNENKLYAKLKEKFNDAIIHYTTDKRYPFECDFYIPSKDLFIELNIHWTHGFAPFDENNKKHIERLNLWKSKNTEFYNIAIDVWTNKDPLKLKTFIDNRLNYKIFYSEKEFNEWFNKQ